MFRNRHYPKVSTYLNRPQRVRRGSAIVYLTVSMPVLFLMASLAVDYGRATSAKSQLQDVVDSATRAAAQELVNFQSNTAARASAISVASANRVNGQTVTLDTNDVVFGAWDPESKTFTPNAQTTNAVRVSTSLSSARGTAVPTFFAAMAGKSSQNVNATATAYITQQKAPFNATGNVTFNHTGTTNGGSWTTDSFVGNLNAYSGSSVRNNGNLLTKGNVTYNFVTPANAQSGTSNKISNVVMGTIYSQNGSNVSKTWSLLSTVSGTHTIEYGGWNNAGASTEALTAPENFTTPTMPANNVNPAGTSSYTSGSYANGLSDLSITDGRNVMLPGGTYTLNSLTLTNGSKLSFSGPVKIYIANGMTISSAAIVPQVNNSKYMAINLCGTGGGSSVSLSNLTQHLYADINAPGTNVNFTQSNNGYSVIGRINARDLTVNCVGNGGLHGDESLLRGFQLVR